MLESTATLDEAILVCRRKSKGLGERLYCIDTLSVPHAVRGYSDRRAAFVWMRDCKACRGRGFTTNPKRERADCAKCRGDGQVVEATFNG